MEKNKKNQPPQASGRGPKNPDSKNSTTNSKTSGTGQQKPTAIEEDNARMRFENEYEQTNTKEEFDRKPGTNQSSGSNQGVNQNSNQNYKSNSPDSNEGLNQSSKQSKEQITNKGINQDTESINK